MSESNNKLQQKKSIHIDADLLGKIFFFLGLSLELFYELWDKSNWQIGNDGLLFRISFFFFFAKVLFTKYTKREKISVIVFAVIGFVAYKCSSRNDVLRVIILIAACKGIELKKMLKYVFGVTLAGCLAIVLMSIMGIAGTISRTAEYRAGIIEKRYVFGMGHPNALHCMFWALVTLWIFIYWEKLRWYHYLMLAAANYGLFLLTDSRTGVLMTMLALVIAFFVNPGFGRKAENDVKVSEISEGSYKSRGSRLRDINGHIAGWAGIAGTLAAVLISLAAAYYGLIYNKNGLWRESHFGFVHGIDARFFNGRLWNAYGYPDSHIGVFRLFSSPECTRYMDLGYYKLFYMYGYIPAILYIAVIIALLWYGMKKKSYDIVMFVTSWAAYNFLEAHEISEYIGRNYLYLIMGTYWMVIMHADTGQETFWLSRRKRKYLDKTAEKGKA